jgi:hypothetical protein
MMSPILSAVSNRLQGTVKVRCRLGCHGSATQCDAPDCHSYAQVVKIDTDKYPGIASQYRVQVREPVSD